MTRGLKCVLYPHFAIKLQSGKCRSPEHDKWMLPSSWRDEQDLCFLYESLSFLDLPLVHSELGAALRLAQGELHHAAHVRAGVLQGEFVDRPVVFQTDRGARLKGLSVQSPDGRLVYGDGHLALERRRLRLGYLHVLQLFDHYEGLSCTERQKSYPGMKENKKEVWTS